MYSSSAVDLTLSGVRGPLPVRTAGNSSAAIRRRTVCGEHRSTSATSATVKNSRSRNMVQIVTVRGSQKVTDGKYFRVGQLLRAPDTTVGAVGAFPRHTTGETRAQGHRRTIHPAQLVPQGR